MSRIEPIASDLSCKTPSDPPKAWSARLAGYTWMRQTIGRSGAAVFRLKAHGCATLFIKTEPARPFGELLDEIARLRWLAASGIACAKVLAEERDARRHWLLMSAVPGRDLASSQEVSPGQIVDITADALCRLHALDVRYCPFDHRLDFRFALARARMEAGLVDEKDFDDERVGRTPADLFEELLARRPHGEDLVVAHGDACLPNLLADKGLFTGFVDCGRLGVADRHQDLALASWSIHYNLGKAWVKPFLKRYGRRVDPARLAFYRVLDEFF